MAISPNVTFARALVSALNAVERARSPRENILLSPLLHFLEMAKMHLGPEGDWSREISYAKLLNNPEVATILKQQAQEIGKSGLTELLEIAMHQRWFLPVAPRIVQDMLAKLKIRSVSRRNMTIAKPSGIVLVRALCSLKKNGQVLRYVHQRSRACTLVATIPFDTLALEADLIVRVSQREHCTAVEAAEIIRGQRFAFGEGNRRIERLFHDLHQRAPFSIGPGISDPEQV
jgi:hypothetical protein